MVDEAPLGSYSNPVIQLCNDKRNMHGEHHWVGTDSFGLDVWHKCAGMDEEPPNVVTEDDA